MKIDDSQLWSGLIGLALGALVVWQGYEHGIGVVTEPGTGFILFYGLFSIYLAASFSCECFWRALLSARFAHCASAARIPPSTLTFIQYGLLQEKYVVQV